MARVFLAALVAASGCAPEPQQGDRAPDDTAAVCPDAVPDWSDVRPVLERWCTGCHAADRQGAARSGAPAGLDLDTWAGATAWADAVADAVGPAGTMPPLGGLTDEERDALIAWARCGAPGGDEPPPTCDAPRAWPGDLFVLHESDTAGFCDRYNAVDGKVQILGLGADDLHCLCEVTGDLVVSSPWVTALHLPKLQTVGGNLSAIDQGSLERVDLPALTAVGGELRLVRDDLASVALPALETIGGSLYVQEDTTLGVLELPALVEVGADLLVTLDDALVAVRLPALEAVGGLLEVRASPAVAEVDLPALREVGGTLRLQGLDALGAAAWPSLEEVGGSLEVLTCATVQAVTAPPSLRAVGADVRVRSNDGLERVHGFAGLERLDYLTIAENPRLRTISGFISLQRVDVQLTLAENDVLTALPRLPALRSVGGQVEIIGNAALQRIDGFPALDATLADVRITDDPALIAIDGFATLRAVGALELRRLPALASADGLARIGGSRSVIVEGTGLADLHGLRGLEAVEDGLVVLFNTHLSDISGLHGLTGIGGDLEVGGNPVLPKEAAWDLLDAIGLDAVGGTIYLEGNAL